MHRILGDTRQLARVKAFWQNAIRLCGIPISGVTYIWNPLLDGKMPILTYLLESGETKLGVIV